MIERNALSPKVRNERYEGMRINPHPSRHPLSIQNIDLEDCKSMSDIQSKVDQKLDDYDQLRITGIDKFKVIFIFCYCF